MDKNNIFFANSGLTSTSANHVANLAKEFVQNIECELNSVEFINSAVSLIGSSEYNVLKEGWKNEDVLDVELKLLQVGAAKSLIAWLREAIKARQAMKDNLMMMTINTWAEKFGYILPETPTQRKVLTKDDVVAGFSVKKRNRMYSLETDASVIGKYIHPDGHFAKARKEYMKRLNNKHEVNGNGRDTLLYKYTPSCDERVLEETYFKLQKIHRGIQAELNGILHEIDEAIHADSVTANAEYSQVYNAYKMAMSELETQFKEYKLKESKRIGDLKIIIPDDLKAIYELINKLGKVKA